MPVIRPLFALPDGSKMAPMEIEDSTSMDIIKPLVAMQMELDVARLLLIFNNMPLSDSDTLLSAGVKSDDVVQVILAPSNPTASNIPRFLFANAAALQTYINDRPTILEELLRSNPTMAEAVLSPTPQLLSAYIAQKTMEMKQKEMEEQQRVVSF